MTSFPTVTDLLAEHGSLQKYTSPTGNYFLVFPTCQVPLEYLFEERWHPFDKRVNHGNFRRVRHIAKLEDGTKANFYVKSPEVVFTASRSVLEKGKYWWGGPRSGEKSVAIVDHPLIQEQSQWEALILLGLYSAHIAAEIPYALLVTPQGKQELIVGEVRDGSHSREYYPPRNYLELERAVHEAGFTENDFAGHNMLQPKDGLLTIIDVNRWRWSPYTDAFDQQLLTLVKEKAGSVVKK
ncbi:hypothetical protein HYT55_00305 [Candidatus Woesearchaeota archaeon]|nr:hypothetical protein [Candidatus Woesearchaeota archaeon]